MLWYMGISNAIKHLITATRNWKSQWTIQLAHIFEWKSAITGSQLLVLVRLLSFYRLNLWFQLLYVWLVLMHSDFFLSLFVQRNLFYHWSAFNIKINPADRFFRKLLIYFNGCGSIIQIYSFDSNRFFRIITMLKRAAFFRCVFIRNLSLPMLYILC